MIWLKTGILRNFLSVADTVHYLLPMDCGGVTGAKTSRKMLMSKEKKKKKKHNLHVRLSKSIMQANLVYRIF